MLLLCLESQCRAVSLGIMSRTGGVLGGHCLSAPYVLLVIPAIAWHWFAFYLILRLKP